MSKITLPLFVLALLPVGASARDGVRVLPTSEKRPNVLVIMTDDVGYGDFSCYGAKRVHTPNIDRLAANGVRFTDAHACASTSTPSRYGFLTGEYPFRRPGTDVAAGNAAMVIRPEQFTLADLFKAAGYTTAAIGKWHLGLGSRTAQQDWNGQIDLTPADLGFDYSCIMAATADRVPCVFIENGRVRNYDASAPIQVSYRSNFSGEPTGKSNPELLRLRPSHGHDMSIVNGISRIGFMKGGGKALWKDENIADSIADYALRWITATQQPEDSAHRPFFMYLCTNDVHVPRWPHERFRGKSPMGLRGDAIVQLDWTVGQIMDGLHKLGIADNTLVILTSDNGPVLDDGYADDAESLAGTHRPGGPWRGGKYSAFEAGSAVPFIVSWPAGGVRRGGESRALISLIDGVRSLAPIAGVELNDTLACDSRNFCDTWLGRSGEPRHYILSAVPEALDLVGLAGKERRLPHELSGGEQQRVAIARAMVNRPKLLLADEPTGNLDPSTSVGIMRLLDRINRQGTTVVMATHDDEIVDQMRKRVIELKGGEVVRDQDRGVYGSDR